MIECPNCRHVWDNHPSKTIPKPPKTTEERFWDKVDKSGDCWIWKGRKRGGSQKDPHPNENGAFDLANGRIVQAHRFSWTLKYGEIPKGMIVMHRCGNTLCVHPEHLVIGVYADQNQCQRALTPEQVSVVGERYLSNKTGRFGQVRMVDLAKEYDVSLEVIKKAVREYRQSIRTTTEDSFPELPWSE